MTSRLVTCLCTMLCATASPFRTLHAAEPLARCYLIPWHTMFRVAPRPQQVRQWADLYCTIESPAQLARLKAILRLEKLRTSSPSTRDLRLVIDLLRADGSEESYYGDRFYLMSADFRHSRRVNGGFEREIDSFIRSCPGRRHLTRRSSEPRPAPMRNFRLVASSSLQPRALSGAVADLVSR
jgi:hypothetical protein